MLMNVSDRRVFLACGATDMRKSIDGLAGIVQAGFSLDPFENSLFVFCNKNRNRIKILEWDGNGFWLHLKRLEKGRFRWPEPGDEPTMTLTGEELSVLLGGTKVELKIRRKTVFERRAV